MEWTINVFSIRCTSTISDVEESRKTESNFRSLEFFKLCISYGLFQTLGLKEGIKKEGFIYIFIFKSYQEGNLTYILALMQERISLLYLIFFIFYTYSMMFLWNRMHPLLWSEFLVFTDCSFNAIFPIKMKLTWNHTKIKTVIA